MDTVNKWLRWPAATVRRTTMPVEVLDRASNTVLESRMVDAWLVQRGRSEGQSYAMPEGIAAWRTLGDLVQPDVTRHDLIPADHIAAAGLEHFARCYGPLNGLAPDDEYFGLGLAELAIAFRDLAGHWTVPEGPDDVSHPRWPTDVGHEAKVARRWLTWWTLNQPHRLIDTLAYVLAETALQQLDRPRDMRRCVACSNWIELIKATRRHCDAACRVAAATGKGMRGRRRSREG